MTRSRAGLGTVAATALVCAVAVAVRGGPGHAAATASSCALDQGPVKHIVYLQFDNTHYRRDRPNVASDLQQMPHLLNFLQSNGTLFTNDHTILISHTAGGILSSLTGLYPDRNGQTVSNSYGFFRSDGAVAFSSSFKYWTDEVDATLDPKPNMITLGGKTTPAPWVPYTRAGCDFGGVGTANIELENVATNATGDMTRVFGVNSPEWNEAVANPALAQTDFVGIAIHCSQAPGNHCTGNQNARPDPLPDEPGGYNGFSALYGAKYVDGAISSSNCILATDGQQITDPAGHCGFPGFDGMLAKNTLGYVAQMQENGVPVTYGYISDAHDFHAPDPVADTYRSSARGPGEADFVAQLRQYDDAFAAFFQGLAAHGITKANTLFVVTVDEGDHFAGGIGTPQADGTLAYAHASCATLTSCPANQIGEVNGNLAALMPAGEPAFSVHSDDAPTVYVAGHPGATDPAVRKLERDAGAITVPDPYVGGGQPVRLTEALADETEMRALHMVNADPNRTPTFTLFANPDFFLTTSNPPCGANPCVAPSFAWNHGDFQEEIGNTWVGIVGPGVVHHGIDAKTWTDHTNVRPTILALARLKDDYVHDGRVLLETLAAGATPKALQANRATALELSALYEKLNAPFGPFCLDTLAASTTALEATDEARYASLEASIAKLTASRNFVAGKIKTALDRAAFKGTPIRKKLAAAWLKRGRKVLADAAALKGSA